MSSEDWYRNKEWNAEIEDKFFDKLKRARRKEQYLRIQASTIAENAPDVALSLLNKYFALNDDFEHAQAYCDMAEAYLVKGNIENAVDAYGKALDRELEFPKLKTDAYILYPLAIVKHKITNLYHSASEILDENQERLMFPIDSFRWHAAKAIIAAESGDSEQATNHANIAFDVAKIDKSGFRFHQHIGLVGEEYNSLLNELRTIQSGRVRCTIKLK